jgi:hypothetical protein
MSVIRQSSAGFPPISGCGASARATNVAPPEAPASGADLVYERVDDGWAGYDESPWKHH